MSEKISQASPVSSFFELITCFHDRVLLVCTVRAKYPDHRLMDCDPRCRDQRPRPLAGFPPSLPPRPASRQWSPILAFLDTGQLIQAPQCNPMCPIRVTRTHRLAVRAGEASTKATPPGRALLRRAVPQGLERRSLPSALATLSPLIGLSTMMLNTFCSKAMLPPNNMGGATRTPVQRCLICILGRLNSSV